jgi:DNA-nicking Smr family endonuclease
MSRRPRRGALSDEERALWARVAETARPLHSNTGNAGAPLMPSAGAPGAPSGPAPVALPPPAALRAPQTLRPEGRSLPPVAWSVEGPGRPRPASAITPGIDRNTARRLARGRLAPQARLDLHGMTADHAHRALCAFMAHGAASGLRCVLVVTGKGRGEDGGARGEGVLRRDTPRWLSVPPLRDMVVGVFEAHQRHGGAGALYVYLRRRR